LADPEPFFPTPDGAALKYSLDEKHFLTINRKGDVAAGTNIYSLYVWKVEDVENFLRDKGPRPKAEKLAEFASTSNRPGIGAAKWLADNRTIAFLAENPGEHAQVYTVDIHSKSIKQKTRHETSVRNFAYDQKTGAMLYTALAPFAWTEDAKDGVLVGSRGLIDLMPSADFSTLEKTDYFVQNAHGEIKPVKGLATSTLVGSITEMIPSPDGKWAVMAIKAPIDKSAWWTDYEPVTRGGYFAAAERPENKLFAGKHPFVFLQYAVINLEDGSWRSIVDAPVGIFFAGGHIKNYWLDEKRVIAVNTFLPVDQQKKSHQKNAFVIEVNVETGDIQIIDKIDLSIMNSALMSDNVLMVQVMTAEGPAQKFFKRQNGKWQPAESQKQKESSEISVSVVQSLNSMPELLATDLTSGKSKNLTDFGAQFEGIELGHVETFEWTTPRGDKITGGLIKPLNYVEGRRYPVVLQSHGFYPNVFLMDGPYNTASGYAARQLAAAGMMVLQIPDQQIDLGYKGEKEANVAMFIAAVDRLDELGLIDPNKVGLHGFSRTGFDVQHAITEYPSKWAAASVSDASSLSDWSMVSMFGMAYPSMIETERVMGATLADAENAKTWAANNPAYKTHRITAPVKIESYGGIGPVTWWQTYTLLRRQSKPVEYLYYPYGTHNLFNARERNRSQQTAVDWYRFWLLGEEDANPKKSEQYKRWRTMKNMQKK